MIHYITSKLAEQCSVAYTFNMTCFDAQRNPFGGCVVDASALPQDPEEFKARLEYSIAQWKAEGLLVAWLALQRAEAQLIPVCINAGFVFHHAEGETLQMTLALVPGSFVPPYSTHYIGAGGVVIDKDNRLLVVSEKYRQMPGRSQITSTRRLKLPGGALQEGEHIAAAVIREVKEETGIDAKFEFIACFRHWHNYRYGKSDIYFVCRLTPLSTEITMDTVEIAECLWLPVNEFLDDPEVHPFNKMIVRAATGPRPGLSEMYLDEYNSETHELLVLQ